jgi:hypothetical protein
MVISAGGLFAFSPQGSDKKPMVFKSPSGYMPADFSGHVGKLFLDPARPAGMFVGYPKDGQDMNAFTEEVKGIVAGMFLHEVKNPVWSSVPLPPHQGVDSETGHLITTGDDKMEVQVVFFSRPEGFAYGYFGMRHKKAKGDDAKFVDANGMGVKAFDELVKSINNKPKQ